MTIFEQALNSVDIVNYIKKHVSLKKRNGLHYGLCPFHDEKTPSFVVYGNGFHCFGCGCYGDVLKFVEKIYGMSKKQASEKLLNKVDLIPIAIKPKKKEPEPIYPEIDWFSFVKQWNYKASLDLARYRGYSNLFCFWLRANALIGMHNNQICFPIHENGIVKRVHVKMNDRKGWYYYPSKGPKIAPLIIGKGNIYHVFESQWDMLAVMDQNQYHEKQEDVYIATRGAFNTKNLTFTKGSLIIVYPQNDEPGLKFAKDIKALCSTSIVIEVKTPEKYKDANDFIRAGGKLTITKESKTNGKL